MIELLTCNCTDCTHWQIVRDKDGKIHLHCKTCDRRDEMDSFTVHVQPGNQVKWVPAESE